MKKTTFFILAAMVFVLIVGFFTVKLTSEAWYYCYAKFEWECDAYAQLLCLGDTYFHVRYRSWCEEDECWGEFDIYCDGPGGFVRKGAVKCPSGAAIQCMEY